MCGIFGVIGGTLADYLQLGERNTERGNLGFGGLFIDTAPRLFHYVEPFNPNKVPDQPAPIMLGHVRAPTAGRSDRLAEVHPFETSDLLLAHNGLLLNHAQFQTWSPDPSVKVDSLVIIGGIQQQLSAGLPIIDAIKQTIELLDGQQACWLWDKRTSDLYLWRVMSPIYVGMNHGLGFSSIKDEHAFHLLDEGVIYRLQHQNFSVCATFKFHNPYR